MGSGDEIVIKFEGAGNELGLQLHFADPPYYKIGACFDDQTFTMPAGHDHIWTVQKEEDSLLLECDGVTILDYKFSESTWGNCEESSRVIEAFKFRSEDTATSHYRADPGGKL